MPTTASPDFSATTEYATIELCKGSSFIDHIYISNKGPDPAYMTLVPSGDGLKWSSLVPQEFFIGGYGSQVVENYINPSVYADGEYSLVTEISSNSGLKKVLRQKIVVKTCPNIKVSIADNSFSNCPCSPTEYRFTVTNSGDFTDTIMFSVDLSEDYYVIAGTPLVIGPGETETVYAYVTMPCDVYGDFWLGLTAASDVTGYSVKVPFFLNLRQECYDYEAYLGGAVGIGNMSKDIVIFNATFGGEKIEEYTLCSEENYVLPIILENKGEVTNTYQFSVYSDKGSEIKTEDVAELHSDLMTLNKNSSGFNYLFIGSKGHPGGNFTFSLAIEPERGDMPKEYSFDGIIKQCVIPTEIIEVTPPTETGNLTGNVTAGENATGTVGEPSDEDSKTKARTVLYWLLLLLLLFLIILGIFYLLRGKEEESEEEKARREKEEEEEKKRKLAEEKRIEQEKLAEEKRIEQEKLAEEKRLQRERERQEREKEKEEREKERQRAREEKEKARKLAEEKKAQKKVRGGEGSGFPWKIILILLLVLLIILFTIFLIWCLWPDIVRVFSGAGGEDALGAGNITNASAAADAALLVNQTKEYVNPLINLDESGSGEQKFAKEGEKSAFIVNGQQHEVTIESIREDSIILELRSDVRTFKLDKDEPEDVDTDSDGNYDTTISYKGIVNGSAVISYEKIKEGAAAADSGNVTDGAAPGESNLTGTGIPANMTEEAGTAEEESSWRKWFNLSTYFPADKTPSDEVTVVPEKAKQNLTIEAVNESQQGFFDRFFDIFRWSKENETSPSAGESYAANISEGSIEPSNATETAVIISNESSGESESLVDGANASVTNASASINETGASAAVQEPPQETAEEEKEGGFSLFSWLSGLFSGWFGQEEESDASAMNMTNVTEAQTNATISGVAGNASVSDATAGEPQDNISGAYVNPIVDLDKAGAGNQTFSETGEKSAFIVNGQQHEVTILRIKDDSIIFEMRSEPVTLRVDKGEKFTADTDSDGKDDTVITYMGIKDGSAVLSYEKIVFDGDAGQDSNETSAIGVISPINESMPSDVENMTQAGEGAPEGVSEEGASEETAEQEGVFSRVWGMIRLYIWYVILGIIVLFLLILLLEYLNRKKKGAKAKNKKEPEKNNKLSKKEKKQKSFTQFLIVILILLLFLLVVLSVYTGSLKKLGFEVEEIYAENETSPANMTNETAAAGSIPLEENSTTYIWRKNTEKLINLNKLITDADNDRLAFKSTPVKNISIMIDDGIVTMTPDEGWYGVGYVNFIADDGMGGKAYSPDFMLVVLDRGPWYAEYWNNLKSFFSQYLSHLVLIMLIIIILATVFVLKIRESRKQRENEERKKEKERRERMKAREKAKRR